MRSLAFPRRQHFGYASRHCGSVDKHSEALSVHTPSFRSSMSARIMPSGWMPMCTFACFSKRGTQRGPVLCMLSVLSECRHMAHSFLCVRLFHSIVRVHFIVFSQLLTVLVCVLSFPLFDHSWRINGTALIRSGPRGGMTPGDPPRAGFQHFLLSVLFSLSTGQHQHNSPGIDRLRRLQFTPRPPAPSHRRRTHTARDRMPTQTHSLLSPDTTFIRTLPLSLVTPAPLPMTLPLS